LQPSKLWECRPQLTIATATVFCHRFYSRHAHAAAENSIFTIATACLFLAGKVEETPKSLREVVRVSYLVQHKNEYDFAVKQIHQQVGRPIFSYVTGFTHLPSGLL